MEFIPQTTIKLLRNVPLDNTYSDTLTFANASAQLAYFATKILYTLENVTYQRIERNIRVDNVPENIYQCNYLMFQNSQFGTRWFYAFIKEVKYINESMCEIYFEIDVMQTWLFDHQLKASFVEREHVSDDTIGIHTVPENVELGGYVTTDQTSFKANDLVVCLMATEDIPIGTMNPPAIVGGFPVPCYWKIFGILTDITMSMVKGTLDAFAVAGKSDAVVSLFLLPYSMASTGAGIDVNIINCASRTLTYTPKNNKLKTYPYCALAVNALGQGLELRYELFDNPDAPQLKTRGGFGANMQIACNPINYEGQAESLQNTLTIKDFPLLGWTSNYFQNWLAQNKANITMSTITSVAGIAGGVGTMMATGGLSGAGGVAGGVTQIGNTLASIYTHSIIPDKMSGSANAGDIFAISGLSGFYTYCRTIRAEYAKIIDDYFTMFGYKVNALKVPNIYGRKSFNYVKTIDAVIVGNVPVDAMSKLKNIFNKGVTFWHGDWVGDYERDNTNA